MKKVCILFIACLILVSFAGCANDNTDTGNKADVNLGIPTYNDYVDYLAYVEKHNIYDDFVWYDDISTLAPFHSFIRMDLDNVYSGDDSIPISKYFYVLKDTNGDEYVFYVTHNGADGDLHLNDETKQELSLDGMENMWTHPSGGFGYIQVNHLTYIYRFGNLDRIAWEVNGNEYILQEFANLEQEGMAVKGTETFLGRLMDLEEMYVATEEVYNMVSDE